MNAVKIRGEYSTLVVGYSSYEKAVLGKERVLKKQAFSKSEVKLIETDDVSFIAE
jgi:hypothetical protein